VLLVIGKSFITLGFLFTWFYLKIQWVFSSFIPTSLVTFIHSMYVIMLLNN